MGARPEDTESIYNQRFFQAVVDSLPAHIAILDASGQIISVNHGWRRFAADNGLGAADYGLGQNYITVCLRAWGENAEQAPEVAAGLRALMDGRRLRFEAQYPCHGPGVERWFLLNAARFESEGRIHVVVAHHDISRRIRSERGTHRHKRFLSQIIENLPVGVFAKNARDDYRFTIWNARMEAIFGLGRDAALGRTDYDIFLDPGEADAYRRSDAKVMAAGRILEIPEELVTTRRGRVPVHVIKVPILGEDRDPETLLGIVSDITERKRADDRLSETLRALEEAKAAAESASSAKSDFLARMSHEIRTPMNAIVGIAELMADSEMSPEQREYLETIRVSANVLTALINDILDFSKIEAGRMDLENLDFRLDETFREVAEMFGHGAREKGLRLEWRLDPELPLNLRGDAARLRQILVNLVGNAIKFTQKGVIALHAAADGETDEAIRVRTVVKDTGVGIPPDRLDRIFEPFFQADGSISRRYGGTGLGLAIARHLARLMGGEIGVNSRQGAGAAFWFTARFEKRPGVGQSTETPAAAAAPPPPNLRILLTEDQPANRKVAQGMLGKLGYRSDTAENGHEAIDALRKNLYDLVFMDIQMPGLDGLEATRRIRSTETGVRDPEVPIVAMTAHALKGDRERCLAAGMTDYIAKPIDLEGLRRVIARVFAGAAPASDPALASGTAPASGAALASGPAPASGPATASRASTASHGVPASHADAAREAAPAPGGEDAQMPAPIDRHALMERVGGDAGLVREVLDLFMDNMPEQMDGLRRAISAGDVQEAMLYAHTVKGMAANISAGPLCATASAAEKAAREGDLSPLAALAERMELELKALRAALDM